MISLCRRISSRRSVFVMANDPKRERRYSKSSSFYLEVKDDFFSQNDHHLQKSLAQNALYSQQAERSCCKLCESKLRAETDLAQHGVAYTFCDGCGHLNGKHEDAEGFVEALYMADGGREYAEDYIDQDFSRRAEQIYQPKLDFLLASLPRGTGASILDVGCGAGYFVYAALSKQLCARGIDVGQEAVRFGNHQINGLLGKSPLSSVSESDFYEIAAASDCSVLSTIGVLEHLRKPHRLLDAYRRSRTRYLYFSVPMFSLSAILENAFPGIYPRQLHGPHTHLFTEDSINWFYRSQGFTVLAEWRFGTDVMDLYRSLKVRMQQNRSSPTAIERLDSGLGPSVDALQSVLDQAHFCSEIHCLVSK